MEEGECFYNKFPILEIKMDLHRTTLFYVADLSKKS